MRLTDEQQAAAFACGSVAVVAGAGTGKTALLAARYLHHVQADQFSPLQIVAVTFTEKAAGELRARIRREAARQLPGRDELLAELEAAPISTLHALAARICREHPALARVPPDFSVLDNLEGPIWLSERIESAMGRLPEWVFEYLPYSLARAAAGAFADDLWTAERSLSKDASGWDELICQERESAVRRLVSSPPWVAAAIMLSESEGNSGDLMETARRLAVAALRQLNPLADNRDTLAALAGIKLNGGSAKNWPNGTLPDVKQALGLLRDGAKGALSGPAGLVLGTADQQLAELMPALRETFEVVRSYLEEQKREARVLDFNDLEIHALQALRQPAVAAYYRERWRAFLVDEFQDINPTQAELLERLTEFARLTAVGDEKQSIYGFRRADVTVFRRFRQRILTGGGGEAELSQSFRTHGALVTSCNRIFAPLLGELTQDLSGLRPEPHPAPHVRALAVQVEGKQNMSRRRRVEGTRIAELIREVIDSELPVHDPTSDTVRPARFSDLAILSRTWEPLEHYGAALAAVGIPAVQAGGGNLLATREAMDGWALLRFLADPRDDLALVALLRSPFFAVSDLTLFRFAEALPKKRSWWHELIANTKPVEDLKRPCEVLRELLVAVQLETPSRVLQLADRLTGYTAVLSNLPGPARRVADWRAWLDLLRSQERCAKDPFVLARRVRRLLGGGVEVPRPPVEVGNAVALLTVHSAKGLEWPVVFLPDLTRTPPAGGGRICFDPDLGVAVRLQDDDGEAVRPALLTLIESRRKERETAESRRLLYVGLTRARDRLFLTAAEERGGALDALLPGLAAAGVPLEPIPFDPLQAIPPPLPEPSLPPLPPSLLLRDLGSGLFELPATSLGEYALCPRRFRYRFVDGHPGLPQGHGTGRRVGSLVHVALERDIRDPERLARFDPTLPAERIQEALDLAGRFQEAKIYAPIRDAAVAREQRVRLKLDRLQIWGITDLLGPDWVLDFKTDQEPAPERHRFQLWAYAQATGATTAHIAYLRPETLHTFAEADLASTGETALELAQQILSGNFTPTPSEGACKSCPYQELCDARAP